MNLLEIEEHMVQDGNDDDDDDINSFPFLSPLLSHFPPLFYPLVLHFIPHKLLPFLFVYFLSNSLELSFLFYLFIYLFVCLCIFFIGVRVGGGGYGSGFASVTAL